MIEEMGSVLSRDELLAAYRNADQYVGEGASQSDLERLRVCHRIVMNNIENVRINEGELIGGTLEQQVNHFEAWLIARELEQANGSVTRAARKLGVSHSGLSKMVAGRHSETLGGVRRPKRERRKRILRR
jgi:transcriptional regulator with AAA-type ATPase domain